MIRSKKREYISSLASSVKEKPKVFWRLFKAKTAGSSLPVTLTHNDEPFTTAERKADAFNKYFASTFHPATPRSSSDGSSNYGENTLLERAWNTSLMKYITKISQHFAQHFCCHMLGADKNNSLISSSIKLSSSLVVTIDKMFSLNHF